MQRKTSLIGGPVFLLAGAIAGLLSAYIASDALGTAPIRAGSPWMERKTTADSPAQPYAVAHFLLGGRLPPPPTQMTELTAALDDDGRRLTSACIIELTLPAGPRPRWWSLGVLGHSGSLLTSDAAIAETDGTIRVSVAPTPRPGNWIAAPDNRGFELIYSAAGSDGGAGFASGNVPLFTIKQAGC
ncbi:MAG: DUF1214 domain-containing protein [Aestuariivirga sp.]|jgi:hypothetical protein